MGTTKQNASSPDNPFAELAELLHDNVLSDKGWRDALEKLAPKLLASHERSTLESLQMAQSLIQTAQDLEKERKENANKTKMIKALETAPVVNREAKDSIFCLLCNDPYFAAQVATALLERPVDEKNLRIVTLRSLLVNGPVNDAGMLVDETDLLLAEAETLFSLNILIRLLDYSMITYRILNSDDVNRLHRRKLVPMPSPHLWVINCGEDDIEDTVIRWADVRTPNSPARPANDPDPFDSVYIHVYGKIRENNIVDQFMLFCRIWTRNYRMYNLQDKLTVVEKTLLECEQKGILTEFFAKYREEVSRMMLLMVNQEQVNDMLQGNIKRLEKKNGQLEEKTVQLEEKNGQLEEKNGQLEEENSQLKEKTVQLEEKASHFEEKASHFEGLINGLIAELFQTNPLTAVQTLVEKFHFTPEQAQAYRVQFA